MTAPITTTDIDISIQRDGGGHHVLWFREETDDQPAKVARWYGTREACEARAKLPPPDLHDLPPWSGGGAPESDWRGR